ncbi:MAG: hypothetical protein IPN20_04880 [Haliscomenobacter sp.]|nr:hypothetical protein [Haliscomenobacter sp.]
MGAPRRKPAASAWARCWARPACNAPPNGPTCFGILALPPAGIELEPFNRRLSLRAESDFGQTEFAISARPGAEPSFLQASPCLPISVSPASNPLWSSSTSLASQYGVGARFRYADVSLKLFERLGQSPRSTGA